MKDELRTDNQASLVAQRLKRLPAIPETRVHFLGREDPLEKEMATHSSLFPGKFPWTVEATVHGGRKELDTTE